MLIGDMRKRFTFQKPIMTDDGRGSFDTSWNDVVTVRGKKTTHRSDESVQAMKISGKAIHNIRIRYRTDILSSYRIREGSKYYNIVGPPMEVYFGPGRRYLDITVEEVE